MGICPNHMSWVDLGDSFCQLMKTVTQINKRYMVWQKPNECGINFIVYFHTPQKIEREMRINRKYVYNYGDSIDCLHLRSSQGRLIDYRESDG